MASVADVGRQRIKVTTQVKVVKGLYTEVRNVQHLDCVSRVFALIDRESDG